ncbi:MAG: glycerol-3-phosphate 1-O-acyltransferase PlsY [Chloroflexales bacterium]|nr:glycerol-3-phosphate 1-O-acyltransferase PlsY [Chloroflexales bacterium]
MDIVMMFLIIVASYLLGSIPFSYLVARARGVDLRKVGSGNIGGANVWRSCGFGAFLVAVALDILKGAALPLVVIYILSLPPLVVILTGLAAVLGHTFSIFMGFKGGKAVATSGGVLLAVFPLGTLVGVIAWICAFALTRISSVGSLTAAGVVVPFALVMLVMGRLDLAYALFTCAVGILILYLHRANIQRLRAGTENRFQRLR